MSDDPTSRAHQWWAEARQQSAADEAEVEAWKAEQRDETAFFLPSAKWSLWDWIDHSFDREFFWRDRYAERHGNGPDKP